jgi:CRISPR-associated protein Cmr3
MNAYRASVRDSLVLRDNRPMVTGAGKAPSMDVPWPSTTAGLVRTRLGTDATGKFTGDPENLLQVRVSGPWLVRERDGMRFFPAPRDAVWFRDAEGKTFVRRLVPQAKREGFLYSGELPEVVGFREGEETRAKPFEGARFWSAAAIQEWNGRGEAPAWDSRDILVGLQEEVRTHVALSNERTAREGQLFSTGHRRFVAQHNKNGALETFAIGFDTDRRALAAGAAPMGGERRMVSISQESMPFSDLTLPPLNGGPVRITLLTPAIFAEGAIPKVIGGARVVAAIVPRPEVISGWDFAKNGPKPTRRVVSAGSVFWVKSDDAEALAKKLWLKPVSSLEQDCRDGFGLAIVGPA